MPPMAVISMTANMPVVTIKAGGGLICFFSSLRSLFKEKSSAFIVRAEDK